MTRFHFPTPGLDPWQAALADPEKHWKDRKSAKELAKSWVAAERTPRGLPAKVAAALDRDRDYEGGVLLLGLPEHKVDLPSRGRPSQNDIWAVLKTPSSGVISVAVEGKSGEPFDRPLSKWLRDASPGKQARLAGLCDLIGASEPPPLHLMYQLFHRTASVVIQARLFGFPQAMMLVHSFGGAADAESRVHFEEFGDWLGTTRGVLRQKSLPDRKRLTLVWVDDPV